MTRQEHHKLIRDRVPEWIEQSGHRYALETLDKTAYIAALKAKLVEEAQEAATANLEDLSSELADLWEVMEALMIALDLNGETIQEIKTEKRRQRGGFERRLQLLWTERDVPDSDGEQKVKMSGNEQRKIVESD